MIEFGCVRLFANPNECVENKEFALTVQLIPSYEYANVFPPYPTTPHIDPFHETSCPVVVNKVPPFALPIQLIPSYEYTSVFVFFSPPATHIDPFHAIDNPVFKIVFPVGDAVQLIPL
jgi:hypothetical protein